VKNSLNLGRPFGIKLSIHWTFSLLIVWIVFISLRQGLDLYQIVWHVVFILALFVCVALHEFGHSLVAIRLGGKVRSITLLPIGGLANISEMPESPKDEFLVSAAGPMVNIVIAGLLWVYLAFFHGVGIYEMEYDAITLANFPAMLLVANIFIVAFNLIPAFPMDGGRLFRSALAIRMSKLKATRIASRTGQVFATLFIIAGIFVNPFLVIIGLFVFMGARWEYEMVKYQDILGPFTVNEVVQTVYLDIDSQETLIDAADKLSRLYWRGYVVFHSGLYAGILTRHDLISALHNYGKNTRLEALLDKPNLRLNPDTSLFDAYKLLGKNEADMAPVFDNDKFVGIVDLEKIKDFFLLQKALRKNSKLHPIHRNLPREN
jgi:Zn-dependent protease/CBS domain-containing protein